MSLSIFWKQLFNDDSDILNLQYYGRWKKYLDPKKNSISDRLAWINFPAIDFLNRVIKKDFRVFEYGGGGSTLFFLDRVEEVITVEHNPEWFEKLQEILSPAEKSRWTGSLMLPEKNDNSEGLSISAPDDYYSSDVNYRDMNFRKYASSINKFPDDYFDIVLVDGRARPSCIKHAVNKIRSQGYLILDNADRDYYLKDIGPLLKNFKLVSKKLAPLPYNPDFVKTNIWEKI